LTFVMPFANSIYAFEGKSHANCQVRKSRER